MVANASVVRESGFADRARQGCAFFYRGVTVIAKRS